MAADVSVFFRQQKRAGDLAATQLALYGRNGAAGRPSVSAESAMRSSAVWACLRLRADLISTMPVDVFRYVNGVQVEVTAPQLLTSPGGPNVPITEWLYSTQVDLDRYGNAFGVITARDGGGLPARIDLLPAGEVQVKVTDGEIAEYRYRNLTYKPEQIWHEKQFTVAGLAVGLSPLAYAAWTLGNFLSAQEFASSWFSNGGHPTGHLQNTKIALTNEQASEARDRFKNAVKDGDVFVSGNDWTYTVGQSAEAGAMFLDAMGASNSDVCRFLGVPVDMIDVERTEKSAITYANVSQRNLQLLVVNLNPAIVRREVALSSALSRPRFVKLNTDSLLRMDPTGRVNYINAQRASNSITPTEARAMDNKPAYTPDQIEELKTFASLAGPSVPVPPKEPVA
jgi:HK97 family phage portal protein